MYFSFASLWEIIIGKIQSQWHQFKFHLTELACYDRNRFEVNVTKWISLIYSPGLMHSNGFGVIESNFIFSIRNIQQDHLWHTGITQSLHLKSLKLSHCNVFSITGCHSCSQNNPIQLLLPLQSEPGVTLLPISYRSKYTIGEYETWQSNLWPFPFCLVSSGWLAEFSTYKTVRTTSS